MAISKSTTLNPNLDVTSLRSLYEKDAAAGYFNPSTGEWISQSAGSIIDPNNSGMEFDNFGLSQMTSNELSAYGVSSTNEFAQKYGLNPDSQYMYGSGGESGHGKLGDQYSIYDSGGVDTGARGTYLADWSPEELAAKYTLALVGAGAAGGMFAGQGIPGLVGGTGAAGAELTGSALESALAEASTTAMNAYGGGAAAASSQVAGILEMGGTLTTADVSAIGSAAGLTGTDLAKFVASNAGTLKSVISQDSKSSLGLDDLLKLAGGVVDKNAQEGASEQLLNYLKERQAINDNIYKPGSPEYDALWNEMSRKDAAAGRNSQYGPRSVDLAARIAGLKMDANTKMTTGIGNLYKAGLDQDASANGGLSAVLNDLVESGDFDWLKDFDLGDITDWIGDLFD